MTDISDAELIARFRQGDRGALAALVRRWEGPVTRLAYRVLGNLAEAEEVRQTVFLRLLEDPGALRQPDRFAAWLRRCAVNAALSAARGSRRRQATAVRSGLHRPAEEPLEPLDALAAGDEAARLAAALARLAPAERAVLGLHYDDGLTFAEIADALGEPASTVKSRAATAVRRLRRLLGVAAEERSSHD
jgi:RNA polymerase sigma-70 factor (ECF subfamily)